jgi:hypothetical protein
MYKVLTPRLTADKREFLRISQAVGMGFLIMGVIGYVVKLSEFLPSFLLTNCSLRTGRLTRFFSFQSTFPSTTSSLEALKRFLTCGYCKMREMRAVADRQEWRGRAEE